jgi:hypothetical protein
MRRTYSQIKPRKDNFITVSGTAWLYPEVDVQAGLATTTFPHTYDGDFITCPTLNDLIGVYTDIYAKTTISQPIGVNDKGYTMGVGTFLEDRGRELRFRLSGGEVVIVWRLVKQLSPQDPSVITTASPGRSPNNTIGYVTTFCSYGSGTNGGYSVGLDDVMVLRVG